MQPLAWKKKRFMCKPISHVPVTLTLSTPWMRGHLDTIVCKIGRNPTICLREEAIFVPAQKCPYHVTFDLDIDLEQTLDARSPGDHRVQDWSQSSHLSRSRRDLRKKFTDRRTDGQTDKRRTPRDCISSWNELKIVQWQRNRTMPL